MSKISQYPEGGSPLRGDKLVIARSGNNYSIGIYFLFPFALYLDLNPITATGKFPFSGTAEAAMSFSNWNQAVYLPGAAHSASNFYTLDLFVRYSTGQTLLASLNTKTCVTGNNNLLTTTISPITGAGYLYIQVTKTLSPSDIYIQTPALRYKLS